MRRGGDGAGGATSEDGDEEPVAEETPPAELAEVAGVEMADDSAATVDSVEARAEPPAVAGEAGTELAPVAPPEPPAAEGEVGREPAPEPPAT